MNSILGSNENIISKILEFDPNALDQKSRFKALLMDLLPQDKLTKNLILLSYEERIYMDLIGKPRIDDIEYTRLCKKLIAVCGCDWSNAGRIICLWGEALAVEIDTLSNKEDLIGKPQNVEHRESGTKEGVSTAGSKNIETTSEIYVENIKPIRGRYCGRMRFGGGLIENCVRDNEKFYPIIPFEKALKLVNNKIGMWLDFKIIKIGQYKYAYDLALPSDPPVVVNTGKDVLHRSGSIKTINNYECLVYEAKNDQIYKVYLSRQVKEMGLKEGNRVQFTLGIADNTLFATEIIPYVYNG